jgi:hypothetical protein
MLKRKRHSCDLCIYINTNGQSLSILSSFGSQKWKLESNRFAHKMPECTNLHNIFQKNLNVIVQQNNHEVLKEEESENLPDTVKNNQNLQVKQNAK